MEILGRIQQLHIRGKKPLHEREKLTGLSRNTVRR